MVIQHNISAMTASRLSGICAKGNLQAAEKLSSGYRINRSADDASGLSISEKMRRQIRGLSQASLNAQEGISLVQVADGALNEVHDTLQRMNELCVKAANGTYTDSDREYIYAEIVHLNDEITRIGEKTTFNEHELFNMDTSNPDSLLKVHAGVEEGQDLKIELTKMNASVLGTNLVDISDIEKAGESINRVKEAITTVSDIRSRFGAYQNRLEHTIRNLDNIDENVTASELAIRDMEMGAGVLNYSKYQLLMQSSHVMMAHCNKSNEAVASLLA